MAASFAHEQPGHAREISGGPGKTGPRSLIPVSVITGFLGSGKTTLLNRLLRDPGMAGAVVIINEFGEVGLDHLLVATPNENTIVLSSGCICCTVRGDLVDTLRGLFARRRKGEIPAFDRIVIETTGLANPVPILQTVVIDEVLAPQLVLDSVVTLVDAVNGASQLAQYAEAVKQVAVADRLLITKTDLAAPAPVDALRADLARINPAVQMHTVAHGEIAPESLFARGQDAAARRSDIARWLAAPAVSLADNKCGDGAATNHDHRIQTFSIHLDEPVSAAGLTAWLTALTSLRGAKLLRVKGLLNVEGAPVVIHAVQTLIHEPQTLENWPDEERRSRLVFITRDMPREAIEATLDVLRWQGASRQPRQMLDPQAYAKFRAAMEKFH
ncbi:MAG: GTP-binding protein [Burkholderiales bacterium]|nr:GTP-binding protein [Burkholderiales bacterium]